MLREIIKTLIPGIIKSMPTVIRENTNQLLCEGFFFSCILALTDLY